MIRKGRNRKGQFKKQHTTPETSNTETVEPAGSPAEALSSNKECAEGATEVALLEIESSPSSDVGIPAVVNGAIHWMNAGAHEESGRESIWSLCPESLLD